jgi:hypothetical protein
MASPTFARRRSVAAKARARIRRETHQSYMENSPTYAYLYNRWGGLLNRDQAKILANEHDLDLTDDLGYGPTRQAFPLLELMGLMGY